MSDTKLPFEGIRVIEFTLLAAGPLVGKVLADYGAQNIVIESRNQIRKSDGARTPPSGVRDPTSLNQSFFYNKFNTNKLSITLNLKNQKGIELVKKLIGISDIVIDNYAPHVLDNWGLSYGDLVKIKPDIIMLRMPSMGVVGPYRHNRSTSWILLGLAGLNYATCLPGKPPICPSVLSTPDVSCNPLHGAIALLAALHYKMKTGKGQFIELSQYESTLGVTETTLFEYLVSGKLPEPMANRLDYAAPHGVYRCLGQDKWCAIAVFSQLEWENFCHAIGQEDLIKDSRFNTLEAKLQYADQLDHIVESWTSARNAEDVMILLQQAGIAAGIVQDVEDLVTKDPQLKARGHWITMDHPEADKVVGEGWGFRLSGAPHILKERAPLLGEHNDYILGEILGLLEEEINNYILEGVVY